MHSTVPQQASTAEGLRWSIVPAMGRCNGGAILGGRGLRAWDVNVRAHHVLH